MPKQYPRFLYLKVKTAKKKADGKYLNLKWFMQTLLDRMDRTSMHAGLEARVPFADHRIVEYLWNVPWAMKCKDGVVKGLLRAAADGLLPGEVLYRRKSPYHARAAPGADRPHQSARLHQPALRLRQTVLRTAHGRSAAARLSAAGQLLARKIQGGTANLANKNNFTGVHQRTDLSVC